MTTENSPQQDDDSAAPVVLINRFTLKPGKIEEFIELQAAAREGFRRAVPGLLGGRMHRSLDGASAVLISVFRSVDDHRRLLESELFAEHAAKIRPLIERTDPGFYKVAYESGDV